MSKEFDKSNNGRRMFMSLNSASIIILVIFFAVFFLSLALIVWMLVSVMRQGDERRRLIISKACTNTFLVMIGYLILCTIEQLFIFGGGINPFIMLFILSIIYAVELFYYKRKYGG